METQSAFDELCCSSLTHGDPSFIHQHVVDAYAAQTCTDADKPIKLTFALVGLYLHVERKFTGRQVQIAHMKLARHRQRWPRWPLPATRGAVDVCQVIAAPAGADRNAMIHRWCESVWQSFQSL